MKTPPQPDLRHPPLADRPAQRTHSPPASRTHASERHRPPAGSHRRYPSLSDSGQPWFPRPRSQRRPPRESVTGTHPSREGDWSGLFTVRAVVLLALITLIIVLLAAA